MSFIDRYLAGIEREKAPQSVRQLEITAGRKDTEGMLAYFSEFFALADKEKERVRKYRTTNGILDFSRALVRISELAPAGLDNLNLEELRERIREYLASLPNGEKRRYLNDDRLGFLRDKRKR